MARAAKRLADVHQAIEGIAKSVGELSKLGTLTRDVGRMTGRLGGTPAGVDDVGQMEGALGVVDFVISAGHVPGLDQLWGGYISKAANACLVALRSLKDVLYTKDRSEGVRLFFEEHQGDAAAPPISDALVHGVDTGRHFPGGQPVLDLMWTLMRAPDAVQVVPPGVEDYVLSWRKQLGAGIHRQLVVQPVEHVRPGQLAQPAALAAPAPRRGLGQALRRDAAPGLTGIRADRACGQLTSCVLRQASRPVWVKPHGVKRTGSVEAHDTVTAEAAA